MEEKKCFYYCRFLGEVVEISEWKYDSETRIVHYKPVETGIWETDLSPVDEPVFTESKTDCLNIAKDQLSLEMSQYDEKQDECVNAFITTIDAVFDKMDIISWGRVRESLGQNKCILLRNILSWENDYEIQKKETAQSMG